MTTEIKNGLKAALAQRRSGDPAVTFAITVARYEKIGADDVVVGHRASGEEVRVKLRQDVGSDRRPSIAEFADQGSRNKRRVAPGGVMRVDNPYLRDGVYHARWITRVAPTANDGRAIEGMIRVSPAYPKGDGKKGVWRTADVLTGDILTPASAGELKRMVEAVANAQGPGLAMVRMSVDGAEPRVWNVAAGKDGLARSKSYVELRQLLASSNVSDDAAWPEGVAVEVLPAKRLFFGPEAATNPRLDQLFCETSQQSGKSYSRGFTEGVLSVVRYPEDEYEFVGDAVPTVFEPKFQRLGPETPVTTAAQLQPAEQAIAVEGPAAAASMVADDSTLDELPDFDLDLVAQPEIGPPGGRRLVGR